MSSHLSTARLILPPQVGSNKRFNVRLAASSDGTAVTISSDGQAGGGAQGFIGNYQDQGLPGNDTILGLVVPASGIVYGQFPMTMDGDSCPDPINVPIAISLLTSDGYQVAPSNNGQTVTVYNPINQGELPGAPAGTPTVIEATSTSAAISYLAAVAGTGSAFNSSLGAAITGYVVQCNETGQRTTAGLPLQSLLGVAHSSWTSITTDCTLVVDSTTVSLGTSGTPSIASAVTAINNAAPPGVTAYATGGTGGKLLLVSTNATLTLTDNGGTTNALTVLGYAGPPASVVGAGGPQAVFTGLPTGIPLTFRVFAVSDLGNGPFGASTAPITLS